MRARSLPGLFPLALAVLLAGPPVAQATQAPVLTVHSIWGTREFASDLVSPTWTKDGTAYTTVETDSAGRTDLYRVDALSGKQERLVRGADLVPPGASQPVAVEEYRFSSDGARLLVFTNSARVWRQNTKGTYYVWDLQAKRLIPVSAQPGYQMFAKFSPDGRMVAFVRANNIYVTDLTTGAETAVTADGNENVINGTSDWVYEEELDLRDAFRWSPDGRRIAFWRLDQTAIRPFYLLNADSLYPELVPVRYPKAGTPNSEVKIGVVDLATRRTAWVDLGSDKDVYVAAMDFAGSGDEVWLTRLNRHQNRLDLVLADATSGASRTIMADSDAAWVDAHEPRWIAGGKQFLFESERDGYQQVYLFDRAGALVRRVTPGGWDVLQVYGVDEKRQMLYFTGAIEGPLGRPLLSIGLDGKGLKRLSVEPGSHGIEFAPTFQLYVDTYSRASVPPVQTLRRTGRAVQEADLPPPRPVRVGRSDRGGPLVCGAVVRRSRPDRHLGLELRRLHELAQHVPRGRRVQGGARRRPRHRLALLRHHLHRALHAHPAGEPGGIRRGRPARLRRQPERPVPAGARHGRRQRAFPELDPPGRGPRSRQQTIRHADLPEQDPRNRGREHAREPVRAVHDVGEAKPLARTALAVLTLINLFNYLDRWIVAALAESLKHSALRVADTQLGALMTGFLIVYMLAAPLFGSLGDARSRTRLIALGVAIWSAATALAGAGRGAAPRFAAPGPGGGGGGGRGTDAPGLPAE